MDKQLFLVIQREVVVEDDEKLGDYVLAADNFFTRREHAVDLRNTLEIVREPKIVRIEGAVAVSLHVMVEAIRQKYLRKEKNGETTKEESAPEEGTQPTDGQEQESREVKE